MERRDFIKLSAIYSSGLLILQSVPLYALDADTDTPICFQPHPLLKLCDDGSIIIYVRKQEFGQGLHTSLPMLVAEELDARWKNIRVEKAEFDYEHEKEYVTWASRAIKDLYKPMREAGALAREMLVQAAANKWNIDPSMCKTEKSKVINMASEESIAYKDLISDASELPIPKTPKLKNYKDFKIIGKSKKSLEIDNILSGKTIFSYDFSLPDMAYALVLRCPVHDGTIINYNATKAKNLEGVIDVVEIQPMRKANVEQGVAVVADSFWTAQKAIDLIDVEWDYGPFKGVTSESFMQTLKENVKTKELFVIDEYGNVEANYNESNIKTELHFEYPFLAHAPIEPPSCTATYKNGKYEIWGGYQNPGLASNGLCESFGIERESLQINLLHIGGGFGRRINFDNAAEAMQLAKAIDRPIKLYWSRTDDMKKGAYRPAEAVTLRASIDNYNNLSSWEFRSSGSSWFVDTFGLIEIPNSAHTGYGGFGEEGNLYYPVGHYKSAGFHEPAPVNTSPWRSIGNSRSVNSVECAIDDLAHKAQTDPLEFRLNLLQENGWKSPQKRKDYQPNRLVNVLNQVAEGIGWFKPKKADHYYGIACCPYLGKLSYAAHAFDISVSKDKKITINRVVAAIDCGMVINPDGVLAQMEGAFIWALSAALRGEITLKDGVVQESTFKEYGILRFDEMPPLEIIITDSKEDPGSVGEMGVPSVAPALCNAIFAATGDRITTLPISKSGYELIK
ncbi:molybdopterin-dependent oxidoreductase [Subsaxibacter sp. CAU 1640]|uniref:xanthine dehydrogenase family protein molybdopterin-binding subunit n=1 Tax=Subsaxibacter sp. CAU 1640 TaxID=2933271 RepID=UPI002002CF4B|nr:molybdopterin cofactor-binding domain-containing protein [Subsaxibacter sp. CAU 1640]MCK7591701.1 molybdopterin-dependent oxidoreductase [Subsaxibacter sp. CAU 1640]